MAVDSWTREQTIVVLALYCEFDFKKASSTHPEIIRTANIIGRSPNSVKMKIGNFGSFDSKLRNQGIVGLGNTSKLDKEIWDEFKDNLGSLGYINQKLIANFTNQPIENITEIPLTDIPLGKEREVLVKQRVNQSFFRSAILSSYNSKCCITGLSIPEFLVASHIIPWSKDEKNRLNFHNGVCLNSIHDKAFDKGFISITSDYKIKVSKYLNDFKTDTAVTDFFLKYENHPIILPDKFLPSIEFLEYHYQNIFKK